jgi:hypothetical protein
MEVLQKQFQAGYLICAITTRPDSEKSPECFVRITPSPIHVVVRSRIPH